MAGPRDAGLWGDPHELQRRYAAASCCQPLIETEWPGFSTPYAAAPWWRPALLPRWPVGVTCGTMDGRPRPQALLRHRGDATTHPAASGWIWRLRRAVQQDMARTLLRRAALGRGMKKVTSALFKWITGPQSTHLTPPQREYPLREGCRYTSPAVGPNAVEHERRPRRVD